MQKLSIVVSTVIVLEVSVVVFSAAESETFTGTAARSGTFKRPLLDVNGTRYELEPADKAAQSVSDRLKRFSEGDTGRYVIKGMRGTVKGKDGIVIDRITPAAGPDESSTPVVTTKTVPTRADPGNTPPAATTTTPEVAASIVTVGEDRYTVYDYDDRKLTITSPGDYWPTMPALEPGASVPSTVDASQFPDWKTMAFYDGAKKLGEVSAGSAPRFTATDLTPGYHVFSILATDNNGEVRTADPKLVIVKPAEDAATEGARNVNAAATASGVTIVRSFLGNKGPGWKQTIDVAGAVGPEHVVDFDVAAFVVHDKVTGEILKRLTSQEFWQQVEPAGSLVPDRVANDARMLYDPLSGRWFACAAGAPEADCFLAVSTSSNPLDPWRGARLPLPRINPYMKMGVDRNGLYITSCNGHPEPRQAMNCYVIPKGDAIAPGGPVLKNASNFPALQFSSMPATDLDPQKEANAPTVLLTNEFDGLCDKLYLYRITWSGLRASLSDVQIITLKNVYQTPNNTTPAMEAFQPEPGPKLRAGGGGRRLDSVFVHNGSVFGCNGAKRSADSRPGILWYEVRISDGKLLQEGFVESPDRDFIYPSIAVDGHGNIGIGCTGTSSTEFPSVYVMMHGANDPAGTMRDPVRAVPGTTAYHFAGQQAVNWSHYSATCIDPSDASLLWTLQAYGNSKVDQQWCTAWAAFRFSEQQADSVSVKSSSIDQGPREQRVVAEDAVDKVELRPQQVEFTLRD